MNTNVSQPVDDSLNNKNKLPNKKARRQKRKRINKQGRKDFKKNAKLSQTMSTWAETFTLASNWQIKHQLAYWKARAKALEYENGILHDIIRKNYLASSSNADSKEVESQSIENETTQEMEYNCDKNEEEYNEQYTEHEENEDFEVSEEFIEFLRTNAKYKEDARLERERLKAKQDQEEIQEESNESNFTSHERLQELYGDKWRRISALQMSLMTDFINKSDKCKPVYWPNIPFNFNYS